MVSFNWWKGRSNRAKSDGPQESAAELARKRLVSERLMAAAAVHRHTPEGYAGVQRREAAPEPDPRPVPVPVPVSETVLQEVPTVVVPNVLHETRADVDDERVVDDPARSTELQSAKRPALPLGLPADILALDLNLGEAPTLATTPAPAPAVAPHADGGLPPATEAVDPDRHR